MGVNGKGREGADGSDRGNPVFSTSCPNPSSNMSSNNSSAKLFMLSMVRTSASNLVN